MKDRIANCLCAVAACAVLTFVYVALTVAPASAGQKGPPGHNVPPSCLWEWTAFGWINRADGCYGFCNYPDADGEYIGDLTTTPCLGQ